MKSRSYKDKEKNRKDKTTWGNVEPGPRSAGEDAALGSAEANAEHSDSDNVSSSNMDPEPREGERAEPGCCEGDQEWQNLSKDEKKRADSRKGGYPKN
jgi:hypothetical protein